MALTKRLRFAVMQRDGFRCYYCGRRAPEVELTVDHVAPVALGGTDEPKNLVTACLDCNAGKASASPDEAFVAQVDEDALRWTRAMRAAVELRRQDRARFDQDVAAVDAEWREWHREQDHSEIPRPDNWRERVVTFLEAGLPAEEMIRLVRVAMTAQTRTSMEFPVWRYYVGCCKEVLALDPAEHVLLLLEGEAASRARQDVPLLRKRTSQQEADPCLRSCHLSERLDVADRLVNLLDECRELRPLSTQLVQELVPDVENDLPRDLHPDGAGLLLTRHGGPRPLGARPDRRLRTGGVRSTCRLPLLRPRPRWRNRTRFRFLDHR